ncbi:MAG: hypothetical protein AAB400_00625 [Patescibacteria group bacterium]
MKKLSIGDFLKAGIAKLFNKIPPPGLYNTKDPGCEYLNGKVPFTAYVGMENSLVLARENDFVPLFQQAFAEGTAIGWNQCCVSEMGSPHVPIFGYYRKFLLGSEDMFTVFKELMLSIPGVTVVIKGEGPWQRTSEEIRQDAVRVDEMKEQQDRRLDEFKELAERWEREDGKCYGDVQNSRNITRGELERLVNQIGACSVEGVVVITDPLMGCFTYKRIVLDASDGMEAARLLESAMKTTLRLSLMPPVSFFSIPFVVGHRKNENGHYVYLAVSCGRQMFEMGDYYLFIREKLSTHQNAN